MNIQFIKVSLVVMSLSFSVFAQVERGSECVFMNADLKSQIKSGTIKEFGVSDFMPQSYGLLASSTLGQEEKLKENRIDDRLTDDEKAQTEIEIYNNKEEQKCKYSPYYITDGKQNTAWVEGVKGDGIGEVVIAKIRDISLPVRIWAGYGKSEFLFKANNRPAKIRVHLIMTSCPHANQSGVQYNEMKIAGSREMILKDQNGYQPLQLPEIKQKSMPIPCDYSEDGDPWTYFVAIEILSVYKGSKYQDTCISEISN